MVARELEHQPVELLGRHARLDLGGQHVEALGHQLPGPAHALEGGRAVELDLAGFAQRRERRIDIGHGSSRPCRLLAAVGR